MQKELRQQMHALLLQDKPGRLNFRKKLKC